MVTTTSFNSDLHFTINEMNLSELKEDKDLAQMAARLIDELVSQLKPVMVYVEGYVGTTSLKGVKVVDEGSGTVLVLDRKGQWHHGDSESPSNDAYWYFNVSSIVEGFQKIFVDATAKKELHLKAVASRRDKLTAMVGVMNGEAGAVTQE